MIIFDLDGTLANCEHRRHFVDPEKNADIELVSSYDSCYCKKENCFPQKWVFKDTKKKWKPNWPAFYDACDKDAPIVPVLAMMFTIRQPFEIWSGRCESVRDKTEAWLCQFMSRSELPNIRMRPAGDSTPDDILKERWLNERCADHITAQMEGRMPVKHDIEFVVDDRPKVVRMWRRRGIFVFDVNQYGKEF